MAYEIYERTIASPRWTKLAAAGAQPAAAAVGVDRHQGSALPRHLLRRRADRAPTPSTPCRPRRWTRSSITASRRRASRTTSTGAQADGGGVRGGRPRPVARLPRPARRRREVVHHVDEDAARRRRRPPRRAARVGVGPPAARAAGGAAAGDRRRRSRGWRRTARWPRIWEADATFFTQRPVARAVDQEPPRLAARAGADADASSPSWRPSPPT